MPKSGLPLNFVTTTYINPQNDGEYKMYEMDRDSFTLLAMGFTGSKALQFKLQYIAAFNAMEQKLRSEQIPTPIQPEIDYSATFRNPVFVLGIQKKDCSMNHTRFIDFKADIMFPVQNDNSINMSDYQHEKVMDIIGMELKSMVSYGFNSGVFGKKEISVEDNSTLSLPSPPDRFSQLESTQEMLQIKLSAATSQIEELKALKVAENAIKTKAQIGDKKVASAMATAANLSKKNKKLLKENALLKKQLAEKSIFQSVDAKNKF
jgi:hypothetical protein